MTDEQRHIAMLNMIKQYTAANTVSKAAARACLIREGIYTRSGRLRPEYGGPAKKVKAGS